MVANRYNARRALAASQIGKNTGCAR